jgi:hypothetical protein
MERVMTAMDRAATTAHLRMKVGMRTSRGNRKSVT